MTQRWGVGDAVLAALHTDSQKAHLLADKATSESRVFTYSVVAVKLTTTASELAALADLHAKRSLVEVEPDSQKALPTCKLSSDPRVKDALTAMARRKGRGPSSSKWPDGTPEQHPEDGDPDEVD
jgi:hypothetical protein